MSELQKSGKLRPLIPGVFLILVLAGLVPAVGAQSARPEGRITDAVDERQLIELKDHVNRRVRSAVPVGAADGDLAMERMMLLLGSSPAQQESLEELLAAQQDPASSNYRRWLTPREFGEQFGPAPQDVETVTAWLRSHGFHVNGVAQGRRFIEFSGTAAQVAEAFHTEINSYVMEGKQYWANATNPYIPAALAPVVNGIASLHNFPRRAMHRLVAQTSFAKTNATAIPEFNLSNGSHALGPYDFATIYNVLPLWNASPSMDGTGQKIAIVARSNIDTGDVSDFQNLFGLPLNPPQIIVNGPDPGRIVSDDEEESELDVQWSGGVAKGATILLVVSKSTSSSDGIDLSATYIVDNNLAPVLSMSYGDCEQVMQTEQVQGVQANHFYNSLWQQAAAQGISVFVSAGDSGSAGCDDPTSSYATLGLAVSGLASTPYNVAVGGTQFNENGDSSYWNSTADAHQASANRYIPEVVWNESAASGLWASGGGVSTLYGRPAWQTGTGVLAGDDPGGAHGQRHRLLPDVSLAAAGHDGYVVCLNRECPGKVSIFGGTSVSVQAFAGLLAIVNQYTGSMQGNPNLHFYPLASTSGVYHDITSGTNAVPCKGGSPNCSSTKSSVPGVMNTAGGATAYSAGAGYDLATGLGSVDANALVTNWSTVILAKATVTLTVSTSYNQALFGSLVTMSAKFAPLSATGTVQFYDNGTALGAPVSVANGTAQFSTSSLALGTHLIFASYSGDANFNSGASAPINLTVVSNATPVVALVAQFDAVHFAYAPGSGLSFMVQLSASAFGPAPTGTLSVLLDSSATPVWTATSSAGAGSIITLNSAAAPFSLGTHNLTLTYSGDANWQSSTSSIVTVAIANPDFKLTATPTVSVVRGGAAGVSVSSSAIAGLSGSLTLSCSGLPAETSYSFSPALPTVGSGAYLTITTTAPRAASLREAQPPRPGSWRASTVLMLGGVLLLSGARRKQRYRYVVLSLLLAGFLIAGVGCGGGGGSGGGGTPDPGTPVGTYTVTVTATSGALTHNTTFTLTVN
jgi:subtilase family serine protease